MKTEPMTAESGLRIVSPPEWELTARRMEDLFLDYHLALGRPLPEEDEWNDWLEWFRICLMDPAEGAQGFLLIGPRQDDVRGWVTAGLQDISIYGKKEPALANLIVLPAWRGRGYGSFLLRRGENYFRSRGYNEVFLVWEAGMDSWSARRGYESFNIPADETPGWIEEGQVLKRKALSKTPSSCHVKS